MNNIAIPGYLLLSFLQSTLFENVESSMSRISLDQFVPFYNLFGILSIKKANNEWRVCRTLAFVNVARIPLAICVTVLLTVNRDLLESTFKLFMESSEVSHFTKAINMVQMILVHGVTLSISILGFSRRLKILRFVQRISELEIDQKFSLKLLLLWKNHFTTTSILFLIVTITQIVSNLKMSLTSILLFLCILSPYVLLSGFLSIVKDFEIFFAIMLQDFTENLQRFLASSNFDARTCCLMKKYHRIYDLNKEFQKLFGLQLTILTGYVTMWTTIMVT